MGKAKKLTDAGAALLAVETVMEGHYTGDVLGDLNDAAVSDLGKEPGDILPDDELLRWMVRRSLDLG